GCVRRGIHVDPESAAAAFPPPGSPLRRPSRSGQPLEQPPCLPRARDFQGNPAGARRIGRRRRTVFPQGWRKKGPANPLVFPAPPRVAEKRATSCSLTGGTDGGVRSSLAVASSAVADPGSGLFTPRLRAWLKGVVALGFANPFSPEH